MLLNDLKELENLNKENPIIMDTETIGLYGRTRLIQLRQDSTSYIIDCFKHNIEDVKHFLKDCHLVLHNSHYDFSCEDFRRFIPRKIDDTMLLARLAFPELESFSLANVSKFLKLGDKGGEGASDWAQEILTQEQLEYSENDTFLTQEIYKRIPKACFENLSYRLDIESLKLALEYQNRGLPVNKKRVIYAIRELKKEINEADKFLPSDLNVNSSNQCAKLLNTSNASADVLESLSESNIYARHILNKRKALKSLQYMEELANLDFVYSLINPFGATTGRFISKGCDTMRGYFNVQQIPNKHKSVFHTNGYFVCADYPALEIWVTGAMYNDSFLYQCLKAGKDLHKATASAMFSKPEDFIQKDERQVAKKCNFTLLYGAGVKTLEFFFVREFGIDAHYRKYIVDNVQKIYNDWHKTYSGLTAKHQEIFNIFNNGTNDYIIVESALGRKMRASKATDALNYPIQSTGAECTKLAIKMLANQGIKIVNTVHDSIAILAQSEKEAQEYREALATCMFEAYKWVVRNQPHNDLVFKVGATISDNLKGE